jgi:serine/threonine protein kinase
MPPPSLSQLLIDTLEALPSLDGRYKNIKCVNVSPTGPKRGCFSVVFRAYDQIEGRSVALKFFDPDVSGDRYRLNAFFRESEILKVLLGVERCLQLEKAVSRFDLDVPGGFKVPCQYFVVQWVEYDIDDYFLGKNNSPVEKLRLFNEIVLAVEALHRYEIFHRDLKADNLRAMHNSLKRLVIAIDLGTAARVDSMCISSDYSATSVGAPAYAAPEARCGLAGHRKMGPFTDVYALGCLLFELFNKDYFCQALYAANPNYEYRLSAMRSTVGATSQEDAQVGAWRSALKHFGAGVSPIHIAGTGSSVPAGIIGVLDDIVVRLTQFSYLNRSTDLAWARQRIWCAIKILSNQKAYDDRVRLARERRDWRRLKAARVQARMQAHLAGTQRC